MVLPKILVVDDQLINIRLLERKLSRNNMEVLSATNGPEAIQSALDASPDVILLDIMMPGMSGIEVCRRLKEEKRTRDIPVIFVTAQTSKEGKIEGLDVGAADYLIKPIDLDETVARVRTQIRIVQEHRENLRLTRELEQTRKQSSIMHLTEGIAHNLNNLLGVMVGYTSLLKRNKDNPDKIVQNSERLDAAIKRMTRIVHQLTVMGHFKSLQTQQFPLKRLIEGSVHRFQRMANTKTEVVVTNPLDEEFTIITNRELFEGSMERLLVNAYESYGDKDAAPKPDVSVNIELTIETHTDSERDWLLLQILDHGKGLDPNIREGAFEAFVTSSSVIGRGMGLTIVRHSIQCLGGNIELLDRAEGGCVAQVRLPLDLQVETVPESAPVSHSHA